MALRAGVIVCRMEDLGIERVTVDYRDVNGQGLVAITAPQTAIDMFAEGGLSREEFMRKVSIGPNEQLSSRAARKPGTASRYLIILI